MTLSEQQQELLHAWADGETTEPENQVVAELTSDPATRDEARLYVAELKRVRDLLAAHGGVPTPEGLRERVLAALDRDQVPIIRLPLLNWRSGLVAAAAAVVVSLVLVFAPPVEETVTPGEVARTEDSRVRKAPGQGSVEDKGGAPENGEDAGAGIADSLPPAPPSELPSDAAETEVSRAGDEALPKPAGLARDDGPQVLSLNPGFDEPFEVNINLDRDRGVSILQVYNDMLVVGNLHGSARILDNGNLGEWTDGEEFVGHDFTVYDGVEIEVEPGRVPELLSAINRMSSDQGYGDVILPGYMRAEVGNLSEESRELQQFAESLGRVNEDMKAHKRETAGAQGYLPNDAQRDRLRRLADAAPDTRVDTRLAKLLEEEQKDAPQPSIMGHTDSRKVKLVIRLR